MAAATDIYGFDLVDISGKAVSMSAWRGQAMLIVNVASQCGFTPQYKGLEAAYQAYRERGFVVLGFPCNQFGNQEAGTAEEIKSFCSLTYQVTFPIFAKICVNGPAAHPLFVHLKNAARGIFGTEAIKWNFTKFLVGRDGQVINRYGPQITPENMMPAIEKTLAGA